MTFTLASRDDTLVEPVLDVVADVPVVAGNFGVNSVVLEPALEDADLVGPAVMTLAVLCCLVFKGDFSLLFSPMSGTEVAASGKSSIASSRVEFKVLFPPSSEESLFLPAVRVGDQFSAEGASSLCASRVCC